MEWYSLHPPARWEFLRRHRWPVLAASLVAACGALYLFSEGRWLTAERQSLEAELRAFDKQELEAGLSAAGFARPGDAAFGLPTTDLPDITSADCEDRDPSCHGWAARGECLSNPGFMVGSAADGPGHCVVSCGLCSGIGEDACRDLDDKCPVYKNAGRCQEDPEWMVGKVDVESGRESVGHCRRSCGSCLPEDFNVREQADTSQPSQEPEAVAATVVVEGDSEICRDLSDNCERWAEKGECESNRMYMSGGSSQVGQCRVTCGACGWPGAPAKERKESGDPKPLEDLQLVWPVRTLADAKVCVGMTTSACDRGLWTPETTVLSQRDRSRVSPGVGGPTGCKEAWATLMEEDSELPAVLVLLYTLRKYSPVDRDFMVLIAGNVTWQAIRQLEAACVQVVRVNEPFDRKTHVGFNKLSLWLAEEYEKIVFMEPGMWFRRDPDALFVADAPAAVVGPRHPRVNHDTFNSGAFVLKPSRETFFDMMAQAGSIDSAEKMEDGSVAYLDSLFFTGYFVHWATITSTVVEQQLHLVQSLHHEASNSKLHVVITGMPPFSPYTTLDFRLVQSAAVQVGKGMPPWRPGWRIPCAYNCHEREDQHLWEAVAEEWWHYYYDLVGLPLPSTRLSMKLLPQHDPLWAFSKAHDFEHCLPVTCGVPGGFSPEMESFDETLKGVQTAVWANHKAKVKAKKKKQHKGHGRRLMVDVAVLGL